MTVQYSAKCTSRKACDGQAMTSHELTLHACRGKQLRRTTSKCSDTCIRPCKITTTTYSARRQAKNGAVQVALRRWLRGAENDVYCRGNLARAGLRKMRR